MAPAVTVAHRARRRHTECVLVALRTVRRATVQELYRTLRSAGDPISLSTVYREVHRLVAVGRVREVVLPGEAVYLLPGDDLFVCDECGRIEEVPLRRVAVIQAADFFAQTEALTVHGRCTDCERDESRPCAR
jgi:Fe2+ or Zn2+ uptake regulation protein